MSMSRYVEFPFPNAATREEKQITPARAKLLHVRRAITAKDEEEKIVAVAEV
jgi:hypothetical protein